MKENKPTRIQQAREKKVAVEFEKTSTATTVNGVAGTSYTVGVVANTTSSTYGCVIMPLDVTAYPGKVAVAFRKGLSDLV